MWSKQPFPAVVGLLSQLLTGDSPLAANNLGILAADVLLKAAAE